MKGLLKKLVQGLIFGLGFGVAFIIVQVLFIQYYFESNPSESFAVTSAVVNEVSEPPAIQERYLGSTGVMSSNISDAQETVLTAGPGEIRGVVVGDGERVEGLRLRLGLNGSVMSQWATTDAAGEYNIAVPYGEYEVNGFLLDHQSANRALPGLIDSPMNQHQSGRFIVSESKSGTGIRLKFVKPVVKRVEKTRYSLNEPVKVAWEHYPGASRYRVQVYQKANIDDYFGNDTLFDWSSKPEVTDTHLDINDYSENLKSGYFYAYQVTAIAENGSRISESKMVHQGYDFKIE